MNVCKSNTCYLFTAYQYKLDKRERTKEERTTSQIVYQVNKQLNLDMTKYSINQVPVLKPELKPPRCYWPPEKWQDVFVKPTTELISFFGDVGGNFPLFLHQIMLLVHFNCVNLLHQCFHHKIEYLSCHKRIKQITRTLEGDTLLNHLIPQKPT